MNSEHLRKCALAAALRMLADGFTVAEAARAAKADARTVKAWRDGVKK